MRILTKYCLREEAKLLMAALFFFSGLLVLGQVMNLLRMVLSEGALFTKLLSIVALWIPTGMSYAIPMSVLFAILIGYGQMAQQEELTAIRAAGVSPGELLKPAVILGLALSVILFVNEAWIAPAARIAFREKLANVRNDVRIENLITPGKLLTFGQMKFSCQDVEPGGIPVFKNIFFEYSGSPGFRILSKSARVDRTGETPKFVFENGQLLWTDSEKQMSVQFEKAEDDLPRSDKSVGEPRTMDRGIFDLWQRSKSDSSDEYYEFHKKLALIVSPFFFAYFAATLSMVIKKGNRVMGFMLTLCILAGYYILLAVSDALQSGGMPLAYGFAWSANLALLLIGYFFYWMIFVL